MHFHILNCSQCVVLCLGIKIHSVKNSQSPLQREIFRFFLKNAFQKLQQMAHLNYKHWFPGLKMSIFKTTITLPL